MSNAVERPEPTEDQLRAAWAELAQRDWGTFDDARRGYMHWKLARSLALARLERKAAIAAAPAPITEPAVKRGEVEPHGPSGDARAHWGSLKVPHQLPLLDRKRAAAGDRDDD